MNKVFLSNRDDWVKNVEADCYHKVEEPKRYPCVAIYYDDCGNGSSSGWSSVEYVYREDFESPKPEWIEESVEQEAS